jgi:hypothetical protein
MINLSALITDPDFTQQLVVQRSTGAFVLGGWQSSATPLTIAAVVTVAKERDLQQLPEGDRISGAMLFYTMTELLQSTGGATPQTSDTLTWRGDVYRISKVWPYADYGYWKAAGVRVSGD